MAEYRIDDLARAAGTTVRNVRAYQDRGLLPAEGPVISAGGSTYFDRVAAIFGPRAWKVWVEPAATSRRTAWPRMSSSVGPRSNSSTFSVLRTSICRSSSLRKVYSTG